MKNYFNKLMVAALLLCLSGQVAATLGEFTEDVLSAPARVVRGETREERRERKRQERLESEDHRERERREARRRRERRD